MSTFLGMVGYKPLASYRILAVYLEIFNKCSAASNYYCAPGCVESKKQDGVMWEELLCTWRGGWIAMAQEMQIKHLQLFA